MYNVVIIYRDLTVIIDTFDFISDALKFAENEAENSDYTLTYLSITMIKFK